MSKLVAVLSLVVACVEAVDYPGGWLNDQQCVDICLHVSPIPICPTRDPSCLAKKQRPGDYDFLLLEQLFLPQFCRDLLAGVDLTISHRNVNKYPNGIVCDPSKAVSKLSIHGLWPNYNTGFSACCNVSDVIRNQPFDALGFAAESAELLTAMGEVWIDPTQSSSLHTLCELYNHEFQKHGLCYAANGGHDFEFSAREYFRAAMRAAAMNEEATAMINRWAAASNPMTTLAAVTALYQTRVQVLCSAIAPIDGGGAGNRLAAIHVCFSKPVNACAVLNPIDCKDSSSTAVFVPCNPGVPITLAKYTPPPTSSPEEHPDPK
ncbi:Ribonuclease [Phytophthora palmivora]|uniref:Ribonuclease n=1 Tax=Phytophthora palmivora TaxID=4796 RepID=A0A2P4X243_9STRA|nr:Ribonuclease [Phytophthora palmivora]